MKMKIRSSCEKQNVIWLEKNICPVKNKMIDDIVRDQIVLKWECIEIQGHFIFQFFINTTFFDLEGGVGVGRGESPDKAVTVALSELNERLSISSWDEHDIKSKYLPDDGRYLLLDYTGWFSDFEGIVANKYLQKHLEMPRAYFHLHWTRASNMVTGEKIYVPADLMYMTYDKFINKKILLGEANTNGASSHLSYSKALLSGLYEMIERANFLYFWYSNATPNKISWRHMREKIDFDVSCIENQISSDDTELVILDIAHFTSTPCYCAMLVTRNNSGVAVKTAMACDLDSDRAINKAISELILIVYSSGQVKTPFSTSSDQKTQLVTSIRERMSFWYSKNYKNNILDSFLGGSEVSFDKRNRKDSSIIDVEDCLACIQQSLAVNNIDSFVKEYDSFLKGSVKYYTLRCFSPQLPSIFFDERLMPRNVGFFKESINGEPLAIDYTRPHPFI